jgi:hypothetical protein
VRPVAGVFPLPTEPFTMEVPVGADALPFAVSVSASVPWLSLLSVSVAVSDASAAAPLPQLLPFAAPTNGSFSGELPPGNATRRRTLVITARAQTELLAAPLLHAGAVLLTLSASDALPACQSWAGSGGRRLDLPVRLDLSLVLKVDRVEFGAIATILLIAALLVAAAAASAWAIHRYRYTRVMRFSSVRLNLLICVGVALSATYAAVTAYSELLARQQPAQFARSAGAAVQWTPGGVYNAACIAEFWALGVGLLCTYGAMLVKQYRLYRLFDNRQLRKFKITDAQLFLRLFGLLCVECTLNLALSVWNPIHAELAEPAADAQLGGGGPSALTRAYYRCSSEYVRGSIHPVMLGNYFWKALVMFCGVYYAYRARNAGE